MYAELADKLVVTSAVDQFTPAVPMAGANNVQLNVVVVVLAGGATLTFDIQGSNDLQNWTSLATISPTVVGYDASGVAATVGWQYVRVRVKSDNASPSIVTIGANTAQL